MSRNRRLVTAIEVISLTNSGKGREEYLENRRGILLSGAHLVEIDLLCEGTHIPMQKALPPARYFVFVTRTNRRPMTDVWPIQISDPLPTIPIPLLPGDPDMPLNLGWAFQSIYDGLSFEFSFGASLKPPNIPLGSNEASWLDRRLHSRTREIDSRSNHTTMSTSQHHNSHFPFSFPDLSRRELLRRCGMGLGMLGLAGVLADDGRLDRSPRPGRARRRPARSIRWRRGSRTSPPRPSTSSTCS